jgi:2-amino-4-hydroxy-6-hydroxymethyldihydropteridine diphosphokinase
LIPSKKHLAAVALGSNLSSAWGDREATLREAVRRAEGLGRVVRVSSFYDTEPVGYVDQPRFLNGAMLLETELAPVELLRGLMEIERGMGRDRAKVAAKGPRVVDLDLLLYDEVVMETAELVLPHPALAERRFVLEPLAEIAGGMRHPGNGLTVGEMLGGLGDG